MKPSPGYWPRACGLLVALVVARGVIDLCTFPPFEGWDEFAHVGYVDTIARTGQTPVLFKSEMDPEFLARVIAFPQSYTATRDLLGRLGGVDYGVFWQKHDPLEPGSTPPTPQNQPLPLYQAQHSALAYRLLTPVYAALGGRDNLRVSVAGLRVVNLGLTTAAVLLVLMVLRRVFRDARDAGLVGVALAAHPLFLLNGVRVANDALGVLLATITVAAGFVLATGSSALMARWLGLKCLGIGALVGLAVLGKATNAGLVPFAAFCGLAAMVRGRVHPLPAAFAGLSMAVGCLAVLQSELRFNWEHYGSLTSMQEAVINHRAGRTAADLLHAAATIDFPARVASLWGSDLFFTGGWSFLRPTPNAVRAYGAVVVAGLLGWVFAVATSLARREGRRLEEVPGRFVNGWVPAGCLILVAGYTAALAYHMVQSKLAWGVITTNAWYASPALPWFLAVVVAGVIRWPLGRWLRPIGPVTMVGAGVTVEVLALWGRMVPLYTGCAPWPESLRRLAWLQPVLLGTTTLAIAAIAEITILALIVLVWYDDLRTPASVAAAAPSIYRGPTRRRRTSTRTQAERENSTTR
jgi:hypothetical protein